MRRWLQSARSKSWVDPASADPLFRVRFFFSNAQRSPATKPHEHCARKADRSRPRASARRGRAGALGAWRRCGRARCGVPTRGGRVLELTIERPGTRARRRHHLDLCAEISRDLSAALDVADCIPQRYRLEVGSPGVERALYRARDYERFAGQAARLKLKEPLRASTCCSAPSTASTDDGRVRPRTRVDGARRVRPRSDRERPTRVRWTHGQKPGRARKSHARRSRATEDAPGDDRRAPKGS